MKTLILVLFSLIIVIPGARAATYYVGPWQSIQERIEDPNVIDGDEIVVEKGFYRENINFMGKNLVLRSTDPTDANVVAGTIIDGNGIDSVVTFTSDLDSTCVLNGFTITNGAMDGGGIYCDRATPKIINNIITRNSGDSSIKCRRCAPLIKNNIITENPTGISCIGTSATDANHAPIILNNIITKNSGSFGGGIYCHTSSPIIKNNIITQNHAGHGGGIYGNICSAEIENNIISENTAESFGGGISIGTTASKPLIKNNLICHNKVDYYGGGIHAGVPALIINNTIVDNEAKYGGAISTFPPLPPRVVNSILWNNLSWRDPLNAQIFDDSAGIDVSYCNIQGGWVGEGNIDADPFFADQNNFDYHLKSEAGRFDANTGIWVSDGVTSPCIDAGNPTSPIGYEPFPNGGIINMGAYGGTTEASKSYFGKPPCEIIVAGDVNGDCLVNFLDFRLMALHWCEDNNP